MMRRERSRRCVRIGDSAGLSIAGVPRARPLQSSSPPLDAEKDRCAEASASGDTSEQGCVFLQSRPEDDSTFVFFRSEGLIPASLEGLATSPDPVTAVIVRLVSRWP